MNDPSSSRRAAPSGGVNPAPPPDESLPSSHVSRPADRPKRRHPAKALGLLATADAWFIRLPDGRVLRAPSTDALRQHVTAGHVPYASRVRRSPDEEWVALDWTEEFADLIPAAGLPPAAPGTPSAAPLPILGDPTSLASRLNPARLRTVGLRGLIEELIAALDSAMSRMKLLCAAPAGVASGAALALAGAAANYLPWPMPVWAWIAAGLVALACAVAAVVLLTQMAYVELSRLRPARWREARVGWPWFAVNLFVAYLVTAGAAVAAIAWLRWLPDQMVSANALDSGDGRDMAADFVTIAALLLEILLWPLAGFTFLLAPIVVIEERWALSAVLQWWRLVRRHAGRLFLYESVAVLGGAANLAFALPLGLACWGRLHEWPGFASPFGFSLCLLAGLAAAPLIAYLAVAHVFIYLNLRYEVEATRRGGLSH
jgi:hypothetical protein